MNSYIFLTITSLLTALSNLLLRLEMKQLGSANIFNREVLFKTITNLKIISGICALGIAVLFYTIALQKIKLNIAYPLMTGMTVLLIIAGQTLYLKENINFPQIIGILLIFAGISLIMGFARA